MARRLTQQEQQEFFLSLASLPDGEFADAPSHERDSETGKGWAGISEWIALELPEGYGFPPKG